MKAPRQPPFTPPTVDDAAKGQMKRLIVNADDFGFTRGVNRGIVRGFKAGIVTSTTIMANGEAFEEAAELARSNPPLGVGCHLAIVGGRPVAPASEIGSLVDRGGALPSTLTRLVVKLARGSLASDQIAREFRAQVERVKRAGIDITHVDTHKHSHTHPRVMEALAQVAREFGITRVRNPFERFFTRSGRSQMTWAYWKQSALSAGVAPAAIEFERIVESHGLKTPDKFYGVRLTGLLDSAAIRSIMESLGEGTAELMCHPGVFDDELKGARTRLKQQRERELEAVTDSMLRDAAEDLGIELISYREL
jgi:hopanoid biosynthesis associated protein HpnK